MTPRISRDNCQILITARDAFSAFETAVLEAEREIRAGFRLFDFTTRLHSDAAKAIGETWFDLVLHKINAGVVFDLTVSDFDPIVRTALHGQAWRTVRLGTAIAQASNNPDNMRVRTHMHSARIGSLSSLALWPKSRGLLEETAKKVDAMSEAERKEFFLEHPGLQDMLTDADDETIQPRLWPPEKLVPTTHHHKLAVIDGTSVYIGGLDLNDRRYDTPDHEQDGPQTWHDIQLLINNSELAEQVLGHLEIFKAETDAPTSDYAPERPFLTTRSVGQGNTLVSMAPKTVESGLRDAHLEYIGQARDMIYLETQFIRDVGITDALVTAAQDQPDLSLVLILPGAPEDVAFEDADSLDARFGEYMQAECVDRLIDAFGARLFIGSPVKPEPATGEGRAFLHGAPLIYVHAKVSIFDNRAAIVSSANLNGRSLSWDTEAGVELTDPDLVRQLKRECVAHWLKGGDPDPFLSGPDAIQAWIALGASNAQRAPQDRNGFLVPYEVAPGRAFGQNLPGIPREMV
ncbi:phospholipase D-like domain-containing protein [Tateyamaria armeniaca]|uniref:Phospholipase D n=1 Tax=Tateyamaria armeniaca TaxID=2518930 RepID=A0ABW8UXT0_9RHOB